MSELSETRSFYLSNFDKLSESEIARKVNVSRQRIHQIERDYRVCNMAVTDHRDGGKRKFDYDKIVSEYLSGMSIHELVEKYQADRSTIYRILQNAKAKLSLS